MPLGHTPDHTLLDIGHAKGGTIVTLLFGPSTPIETARGTRASLQDFRPGDRITSAAHPDPRRALDYGAGTTRDLNLEPFGPAQALVLQAGPSAHDLVLRIGKTTLIADLSKGTQVSTSKGKLRSLTEVASGLENTRVHELTTTSRIVLIKQPGAKGTPVP